MSKLRQTKTNFTAGELAPELLGRGDLSAYENGAARLRNVFIQPTGGVHRRAGLGHIDTVAGPGRLVSFEFNSSQVYLLVFTHLKISVYMDAAKVAEITAPWTEAQLADIDWTQSADTLLVVHPSVMPRRITRTGHTAWTIAAWTYPGTGIASTQPWTQFGSAPVRMGIWGVTGDLKIWSDVPYFTADHVGVPFRLEGVLVTPTAYVQEKAMSCTVSGSYAHGVYTTDWAEVAFSAARGWPSSVSFHQDRLVIGGSRDLPNQLWMSRIGSFFDFSTGTGLDHEGIHFEILSDQVDGIRHVFSGRHLQVFTTGGAWMVSGEPLTPRTVQLDRVPWIGVTAPSPFDLRQAWPG